MSSSSTTMSAVGRQGPPKTMSSSAIVAEAVEGSHVLKIEGYSRTKGLGNGRFIKSGTFGIGGHSWFIKYYPEGDFPWNQPWVSLHLVLDHTNSSTEVKAKFNFSLVDHLGEGVQLDTADQINAFTAGCNAWSVSRFIDRTSLEGSHYLKDDCFRIRCDVTIINQIIEEDTTQLIVVPPSDLHQHFGCILSSKKGADLTLEDDGATFTAHEIVLAARSSVFMAELFGPMKGNSTGHVRVHDMEARVFKAMLHFIYTDSLPEIDEEDALAMAQHLLVAADRYGLERLKQICENKLCYSIGTSTVATTLALAEQHGCRVLKEACFKFLKGRRNREAVMVSDGYQHLQRSFPTFEKVLKARSKSFKY